eukprot:7324681-Prymnesium_polylepis.1
MLLGTGDGTQEHASGTRRRLELSAVSVGISGQIVVRERAFGATLEPRIDGRGDVVTIYRPHELDAWEHPAVAFDKAAPVLVRKRADHERNRLGARRVRGLSCGSQASLQTNALHHLLHGGAGGGHAPQATARLRCLRATLCCPITLAIKSFDNSWSSIRRHFVSRVVQVQKFKFTPRLNRTKERPELQALGLAGPPAAR